MQAGHRGAMQSDIQHARQQPRTLKGYVPGGKKAVRVQLCPSFHVMAGACREQQHGSDTQRCETHAAWQTSLRQQKRSEGPAVSLVPHHGRRLQGGTAGQQRAAAAV
jgi:hypothetical protein